MKYMIITDSTTLPLIGEARHSWKLQFLQNPNPKPSTALATVLCFRKEVNASLYFHPALCLRHSPAVRMREGTFLWPFPPFPTNQERILPAQTLPTSLEYSLDLETGTCTPVRLRDTCALCLASAFFMWHIPNSCFLLLSSYMKTLWSQPQNNTLTQLA